MNSDLRAELLELEALDLSVRAELLATGELFQGYHPRMEAVHQANARRLREIIDQHGWPNHELAGEDGAGAAWLIVQHAIGEPDFQRRCLEMIQAQVKAGAIPAAQEAYLHDRIAMYEGRPQRYGTQYLPCPDGENRRWKTEDSATLNERRSAVGLPPVPEEPEERIPTAEQQANYDQWLAGYQSWLVKGGWRRE